jgi:N-acetylmuramoyl-L-alanine amidase
MKRVKKQIKYNISNRNQTIRYIVIHDTGNPSAGANASSHFNYFNGGNRSSSADIFVDDSSVWVVNDYHKYFTWHVGDGKGRFGITNPNSVGIEICINQDGNYDKAVQNAVVIAKELMKELNIPMSRVIRHYDASRKNCPASMSANNWQRWRQFTTELMKNEGDDLTMAQYEELINKIDALTKKVEAIENSAEKVYRYTVDIPDWGRPTIQKLLDKGLYKGSSESDLNLPENLLRTLVINDRAGLYD